MRMRNRAILWILVGGIGASIFGLLPFVIFLIYMEFSACSVIVDSTTPSPDENYTIVVYEVDCGATTRFNTQANLVPAGKKFSPDVGNRFLSMYGHHARSVKWLTSETIEIKLFDDAESPVGETIFQKENTVNKISIIYK